MPSGMVNVSASVNLPLHHKIQKFSSGTGLPGWSQKKGRKTVVVVVVMIAPVSRQIAVPAPHRCILYWPDALCDAQPTVSMH